MYGVYIMHAVFVVGYSNPGKYWIVKNSFGTASGDGGYFKVGYGEAGIMQPDRIYGLRFSVDAKEEWARSFAINLERIPTSSNCYMYITSKGDTLEWLRGVLGLRLSAMVADNPDVLANGLNVLEPGKKLKLCDVLQGQLVVATHSYTGISMDLVCMTLIIDDIVLPDGQTCMAQLGGGGSQSLFGFQLVTRCLQRSTSVGLAAGVGDDLPQHCKAWLQQLGCDTSGLLLGERPTPRAWQVFEWDGRRTQVWRVPECPELYQQLLPSFDQLPEPFQHSTNYHFGIHAAHPPMKLIQAVRQAAQQAGGRVLLETYTHCDSPPSKQDLQALLQLCDIFSPNELEAASIVGPGSPQQLVQRLIDAGATTVALRCGAHGAWIGHKPSNTLVHVPAVPGTQVVDVTGCGNAFCGGFLAAQHADLDLVQSSMWGCVAGSIMAEYQGVPPANLHEFMQTATARCQLLEQIGVHTCHLRPWEEQQKVSAVIDAVSCSGNGAGGTSSTALQSIRSQGREVSIQPAGRHVMVQGAILGGGLRTGCRLQTGGVLRGRYFCSGRRSSCVGPRHGFALC